MIDSRDRRARATCTSRSAASTHDGHAFCVAAIDAGAVAVMVDAAWHARSTLPDARQPRIVVDDTRHRARQARARAPPRGGPATLVAITGSAGKTTTKELTRAALAVAGPTHAADGSLNNETGVPLTLLGLRAFHAYGVVEMGMRGAGQIEYLTKIAEPDVAVVVNAGTAHIELLGSTDAIAQAKAEIWLGLRDGGTVVRPADDERLERWRARAPAERAPRHVRRGASADVAARRVHADSTPAARLVARRVRRAPRARAAARRQARRDRRVRRARRRARRRCVDRRRRSRASRARGRPSMRGEVVEVGGRKVIVDCYNANPASMAAALRALAERAHGRNRRSPSLGDMLELGDHAAAAHRDDRRARARARPRRDRARRARGDASSRPPAATPRSRRLAGGRRGARARAHRARRLDPAQGLARHAARARARGDEGERR